MPSRSASARSTSPSKNAWDELTEATIDHVLGVHIKGDRGYSMLGA